MQRGMLTGAAMAFLVMAGAAQAQDMSAATAFLGGVYSTEPGCASGHNALDDAHTFLSVDGLTAIEYDCEFLNYEGVSGLRAFVSMSACSEPGLMTPELILVRALSPGDGPAEEVELVQGASEPVRYYRCAK